MSHPGYPPPSYPPQPQPGYPMGPTYHPPVQPVILQQPAPPPPTQSTQNVNQSNTNVVINAPGGGSGSGNNRLVLVEKHQLNSRDWNSGLCGCLNDLGGCVLGTLCLPILMCRVSNRLNECALVTCCVYGGFVSLRTKLRTMGGIKGSVCDDCITTTLCGPCAACQMSREMDDMKL